MGDPNSDDPVFENAILMAAAAVPVFLALAPLAVGVVTRSVDRVLRLLRTPSLWGAVMNSIIWVLFAFIATKRVECMELILAYPILLILNFTYLLLVYGYHNKKWMATWLSFLVVSCLGYVFYAIKFQSSLPMTCETILGHSGLLILLYSHGNLIDDLKAGVGPADYAIAVLNIVPPGFLNMATCYVILKKHPEQQFIYSALIGFFCAIIEFMLLIQKAALNMFVGDDNGPPALPPGPVNAAHLHAQAAAASAAQAEAAEIRANHIAETLAQLQAAIGQQQNNVENSGEDLSAIIVETAVERPAEGHINSNTAQDAGCGLFEGGVDLGDSKDALSLKKDLLIRKLPEELITVSKETVELEKNPTQPGTPELEKAKSATKFLLSGSIHGDGFKMVALGKNEGSNYHTLSQLPEELITVSKETVELEKNPTQPLQSGTDDRGAAELEKVKSATKFLLSGSIHGDGFKMVAPGKNEGHKSGSSGESKRRKKSQVLAPDVPSGGRCAPSGWKKYWLRDTRPPTC